MDGQRVTFDSENAAGPGEGIMFGVPGDPQSIKKGLILIHEWWGMNDQILEKGDEIAKEGNFVVLVPDIYRGKTTIDWEEAGHMMWGLDYPAACQDISGAAKLLLSRGCVKVGITGFCMGGALSFAAAATCPEISAAAPFYGIPNQSVFDLTKIKVPVQAHFGHRDDNPGFSSPADFNPLNEKLLAAGVPYECHIYDARHAFVDPTNPKYDEHCANIALGRLYKFMQDKL